MEVKHYIHYCCLTCLIVILILSVDPDGVFYIYPLLFVRLLGDMCGPILAFGLCLIIYSHFQAHYFSLKLEIPTWLQSILSIPTICNTIFNIISVCLQYGLNKEIYSSIDDLSSLLWFMIIFIADFYSYYLVRKLVLNGLDTENKIMRSRSNTALTPPKNNTQQNVYYNLLKRMRNFHIVMLLFVILFFITQMIALESAINSGSNPPDPVNPEKFVNGTTLNCFFFLIITCIFTWWSWVPISEKNQTDSNQSKSNGSLDHSSSPLHKSKTTVPTTPTSIIHEEDKENLKNHEQIELLSLEICSKGNIGKEVLSRTSSIEVCNNNPQISPAIELEQNFVDGLDDQDLYVT